VNNNKPNSVRKKALEFAKKGQWDKALTEFCRLADIEQNNPNVFNEIGDIQLKLGNKREAFKRYHEAIDAYAKVGLHNNAIAVCKKILRLNPSDVVVYGKMATLRKHQGFEREALDYSAKFLDGLHDGPDWSNGDTRAIVIELSRIFEASAGILERSSEILLSAGDHAEAGPILGKLEKLYAARGMSAEHQRVKEKMASIGYVPESKSDAESTSKLETVETARENRPQAQDVPFNGSLPPHIRRGSQGDGSDFGTIDIGAAKGAEPSKQAPGDGNGEEPSQPKEYVIPAEPDTEALSGGLENPGESAGAESRFSPGDPLGENLAATLAAEVKADVEEGDHRSHYDLGMAYLEMGLHSDAIREFQAAASSPAYQLRSLEMIGHCLITQGQAKLAVKQLSKGLALVAEDDRSSLGLKYNLAVAYEMVGEAEQAKALFEDVYVVDITFRDVREKLQKYSS